MNLKRERGIALYVALIAAAATSVAAVAVTAWDKGRLEDARQAGYNQAKQELTVAHVAAENRSLLNQREQIITLNNDLTDAINDYNRTKTQLDAAHALAWKSGERVRNVATPTGGELDQRLAKADVGTLRTFGAGAFRTAQTCRDVVAEAGLGAGGLVASSASARFEHARAEGLSKFSMPKTPFKTKE
jgi:hypothetical protein